ncbi:MAG: peptide-modifying radical SAM enzyme CbpB [Candidatus Omnitrophota bacterium]|nr:peptide-modifying radical SAM enzyme CbpB [Candidatus Omnitrophota bacterium]
MYRLNHFNMADGLQLQPINIGHKDYIGIISADTAFWALVRKGLVSQTLDNSPLLRKYQRKLEVFNKEMKDLRTALKPSAVYFNPTDCCNLNCSYCYIPKNLRKNGRHMSNRKLLEALKILKAYFKSSLPKARVPQIIFHGAEPLLNKEAVFKAIEEFAEDFRFGIQTNGTLLSSQDIEFLKSRRISIGLSLDGHIPRVADRLRKSWGGYGVFKKVIELIDILRGYDNYSVICTVTKENMASQVKMIEFLHRMEVPTCMLNPVRCTLSPSRKHKPQDMDLAKHYLAALDRSYQLYKNSGRKLIIANFANILVAIIAPLARRLMCDISPCGGGRCFFAVSSSGDMFPCSEFIGIKEFNGGNIFRDDIRDVLETAPFKSVTQRRIESIEPCSCCAIRHFCGAPCPAEAYGMNGSVETKGAFCELYVEQVRYAFRLIADNKEEAYLWDGWDRDTRTTFNIK